VGRESAQISQP